MRLIHTGDWHIGACRRLDGYLERHRSILEQIFELAVNQKVDALLICGDIFHRQDTTHDERNLFYELIAKYDGRVNTIVIDGNHDETNTKSSQLTTLEFLSYKLETTHIVSKTPKVIKINNDYVIAVPWANYSDDEFHWTIENLYKQFVPVDTEVTVMFHEASLGFETDKGYRSSKGLQLKSLPFVAYYAAGDIHKCQKICGIDNAWYSGSPAQFEFGDTLPKGVLLVDTEKPSLELMPIESKPMVVVTRIEDIPNYDSYVKLKIPLGECPTDLPVNVVAFEYTPVKTVVEFKMNDDLLSGLAEFLANEGLTENQQLDALKIAQETVEAY